MAQKNGWKEESPMRPELNLANFKETKHIAKIKWQNVLAHYNKKLLEGHNKHLDAAIAAKESAAWENFQ